MRSQPLRDAVVEDDPEWLVVAPEGVYREADVSVSEEEFARLWNGWMCAWCYEPWDTQWPERCPVSGCWSGPEMSEERQRRYLSERFGGEKWLGPSRGTVDAWANQADRVSAPRKSGIWVPRALE